MARVEWFVKKRFPVGMVRWDGDEETHALLITWMAPQTQELGHSPLRVAYDEDGEIEWMTVFDKLQKSWGDVEIGDYIVQGPRGEFYPIKSDVHTETYDRVAGQ